MLVDKIHTYEKCKGIHQRNCFFERNILEWLQKERPGDFFQLESQYEKQEFDEIQHAVQIQFYNHELHGEILDQHLEWSHTRMQASGRP